MQNLNEHLEALFNAENSVASIIKSNGLRFSTNKITADLGEYYVFKSLSENNKLFQSIRASVSATADCDLCGTLSEQSVLHDFFNQNQLRIEVKTRRNQKGVKYLSNLHPEKFDLLCVVDLYQNYFLKKIFLVTSETANEKLDKKYGRLIFKEEMAFMSI